MLVEEEPKNVSELSPDAIEDVFEVDVMVEDEVPTFKTPDEDDDEIDIAFLADDDEQW